MIIGIDASRANKKNKTGVEWYAWHLIEEMKKLTQGDQNSWILYTNEMLHGGLERLPDNWYEVRARWFLQKGWTQMRLSWEMFRRPSDVLFVPAHVLPRVIPKKTVVTVHDVGFHRFPHLYKARDRQFHEISTKDIAKKASRVVTVSEFSGREIAECYGISPDRIAITPNGVDHDLYRPISDQQAVDERLSRYRLNRPYFITVGRLEAKKNTVNLIKAFSLFKARRGVGDPNNLVLVGNPGFGYEEIKRAIAESSYKDSIMQLGYVPEADMPYLINAAQAMIHPAWYEGFGIPPVQAMACCCPVLSSNVGALVEVIGPESAVFFPPAEPEAMVVAMNRLIDEPGLKQKLRMAGIARASKYTWRLTAEKTLPVLTQW